MTMRGWIGGLCAVAGLTALSLSLVDDPTARASTETHATATPSEHRRDTFHIGKPNLVPSADTEPGDDVPSTKPHRTKTRGPLSPVDTPTKTKSPKPSKSPKPTRPTKSSKPPKPTEPVKTTKLVRTARPKPTTGAPVPPALTRPAVPPTAPSQPADSGPPATSGGPTSPTASTQASTRPGEDASSPVVPQGFDGMRRLVLDRAELRPGDKLVASGRGCHPGSKVRLASDGERVGEATANSEGSFRTDVYFREVRPGHRAVTASCGVTMVGYVNLAVSSSTGGGATTALFLIFFILVGVALVRWQYAATKRS